MGSTDTSSGTATNKDYKEIIVTNDGGARTILLNRPAKYNALNYQVCHHCVLCTYYFVTIFQMYSEVQHALQAASTDSNVIVTVITGAGDYYCSGNDLGNFTQIPPEGPEKLAAEAKKILL